MLEILYNTFVYVLSGSLGLYGLLLFISCYFSTDTVRILTCNSISGISDILSLQSACCKLTTWYVKVFASEAMHQSRPKQQQFNYLHTFIDCLLGFLCFLSHSRIFHSYGDVTNTGEGLQILTFT